ncbi:MAG: protein disulfide isomerase family protein [Patescibacteria group bacterium]
MKKNTIFIVLGIALVLAIGGFVSYESYKTSGPQAPGPYDTLAQCLKDKGVIFYGAFWCPHCQATKKMFGSSAKLLPYVECSTPDGNSQTQACIDKGIKSYPTWIFPDGSQLTGEHTLKELAEKSSCPLPAQ